MTGGPVRTRPGKTPPPTAYGPQAGVAQRVAAPAAPPRHAPPPTAYGPGQVQRAAMVAPAAPPRHAPPPTAFGPGGGVAQRAVAAPPVAAGRRPHSGVVQRILEITDTKNAYYTNATAAEQDLTLGYTNYLTKKGVKRPLTLGETSRIKELAGFADSTYLVYPIPTEKDAIAYIESGAKFNSVAYYLDPSATPPRETDDTEKWQFTLYEKYEPPKQMEVPQSPVHYSMFDDQEEPQPQFIDMLSAETKVRDSIHKWKGSGLAKSHLGNNHYSYHIKIKYRLAEMETFKTQKNEIVFAQSSTKPVLDEEVVPSPFYTSKKMLPPQEKGGKRVDLDDEMRTKLQELYDGYQYGGFKSSTIFSSKKKHDYFKKATGQQIGSMYFHSEVQAASDEDGARTAAGKVVRKLVIKGKDMAKFHPGKIYNLVVSAVLIVGYSDHRTCCGGACKLALTDVAKLIETEFNLQLALNKKPVPNLYIRRSAHFRVSAAVGAKTAFQGLKLGANVSKGVPKLQHHQVSEFKPFL